MSTKIDVSDNLHLSDEKLVEKIRSLNQELYSIIVERYQNKLLRYANGLVHDEEKAKDIVQNAFIKAFVNLNGFNTKRKFSSWIYRIVHNEAINLIKKDQREVRMPEGVDFKSNEDIEKDLERAEDIEKVERCLHEMSVLYSEPLSLFYIHEKSYEEVSNILRIPMGTVAIRINRGKKIIKKLCQKN